MLALSMLCFVAAVASSMPFDELTKLLPRDVAHIGLDERNGQYVAFRRGGEIYGRFPASAQKVTKRDSTCGDLPADQAQKLPGWDILNQYADENWGTGSRNVETNPEDVRPSSCLLLCDADINWAVPRPTRSSLCYR